MIFVSNIRTSIFCYLKTKKCTVFRVNVPYFYTSVPGKVDRMLAGLLRWSDPGGEAVGRAGGFV